MPVVHLIIAAWVYYIVLHETLVVLMCGSGTKFWKEKERSRIRTVQMDNLRCLLGIRRRIESRMHG